MKWTIWHNPRCGKSRDTLALLRAQGIEPDIYLYLKSPPDKSRIEATLNRLKLPAAAVVRRKEKLFKSIEWSDQSDIDAQYIAAMVEHPILIERPIVEHGQAARIGRPPENVLELLDA